MSHHNCSFCPKTTPICFTYFILSFQGINPRTLTSPELGNKTPDNAFIAVLFPAPFGPINPNISPSSTSKEIPFNASLYSYFLWTNDFIALSNPCSLLCVLYVFFRFLTIITGCMHVHPG